MTCPFTQGAVPELEPPSAEPPLELVEAPLDPPEPPEELVDPPELVEPLEAPLDPPLEEVPLELPDPPLLLSDPLEAPPSPLDDAPLLPPAPAGPGSCVDDDPQATLARGKAIRATSDRPIRCGIDVYLARDFDVGWASGPYDSSIGPAMRWPRMKEISSAWL